MPSLPVPDSTRQIIGRGYDRAARSFASIISQPVSIDIATGLVDTHVPSCLDFLAEGSLTVLTTDLFGAFSGRSLLVFSEEERKEIVRMGLAASPSGDSPEMQRALLLEIDNILAAAVISEFANELDAKIYGGVPHLSHSDRALLGQSLSASEMFGTPGAFCLISHARFVFANNQAIRPHFIWILPADLMEAVQKRIGHIQ